MSESAVDPLRLDDSPAVEWHGRWVRCGAEGGTGFAPASAWDREWLLREDAVLAERVRVLREAREREKTGGVAL